MNEDNINENMDIDNENLSRTLRRSPRINFRRNALDNFDENINLSEPSYELNYETEHEPNETESESNYEMESEPYPEVPALPREMEYETDSDEFNSIESDSPYWYEKSSKEEDSNIYTDLAASSNSINVTSDKLLDKCLNISPLTLEPYTEDDYSDLFIVYIQDKNGKFDKGSCSTKEELKSSLESNRMKTHNLTPPNNIMSIYTTPNSNRKDDYTTGMTGKPTAKLVVRLISNNIYVTYGSIKDIFNSDNKEWYAIPLYGGLRRRIGNVMGIYGASMNHGQAPGYIIYKLLTKKQVENNEVVKESINDYIYGFENIKSLQEILEEKKIPIYIYINASIQNMTTRKKVKTNLFRRLVNNRERNISDQTSELPEWDFN